MANIELKQNAKEDLEHIRECISRDSIYYADKTIEEIVKKVTNLSVFPYMGRKIPEYNNTYLREIIYKSYRILYKVNSNVFILNVMHHSRELLNSININKN